MLLTDDPIMQKVNNVLLSKTAMIEQMNGSYAPVNKWRGIAVISF